MRSPGNFSKLAAKSFAHSAMRGFSLVVAIFLLVVLAALAVAMLSISTVHQASSNLDLQGTRAYQAARTGIEWGLYTQLRPAPAATCFATTSFALPAGTSLSGFTVTVACTLTNGPGALKRWQITSTACNQPQAGPLSCPNFSASSDYVQRVLQVEF
jgi:MSHA biogenesis protein MshP